MNIIKIEVDEVSRHLTVGTITLHSVVLTTKNWLGFTKRIPAFPTGFGRVHKNEVQYFHYCDSLGKEFDESTCKQIMNFLITRKLNGCNI